MGTEKKGKHLEVEDDASLVGLELIHEGLDVGVRLEDEAMVPQDEEVGAGAVM